MVFMDDGRDEGGVRRWLKRKGLDFGFREAELTTDSETGHPVRMNGPSFPRY